MELNFNTLLVALDRLQPLHAMVEFESHLVQPYVFHPPRWVLFIFSFFPFFHFPFPENY